MSTLRNPVGPKDRKVYIRRRLMVLAGIVAVIAVIVLIFVRPGASGGAGGASEVSVPEDIVGEETATPDGEIPECAEGAVTVTPTTDQTSYAEGEQPALSMSIENTGEEVCSADLGTAMQEFEITSGDDAVWRSKDCQEDPEHLNVELQPGEPLETETVAWDRTRSSAETCDITRDPVPADGSSYHLKVKVGDFQGKDTAQFLLY